MLRTRQQRSAGQFWKMNPNYSCWTSWLPYQWSVFSLIDWIIKIEGRKHGSSGHLRPLTFRPVLSNMIKYVIWCYMAIFLPFSRLGIFSRIFTRCFTSIAVGTTTTTPKLRLLMDGPGRCFISVVCNQVLVVGDRLSKYHWRLDVCMRCSWKIFEVIGDACHLCIPPIYWCQNWRGGQTNHCWF